MSAVSVDETISSLHNQCGSQNFHYSYDLRGYEDMNEKASRPKDITRQVNDRLFPMIPDKDKEDIIWVHATLQGYPSTGKTKMLEYLYLEALTRYGEENINLIWTNDPSIAFSRINSRPVQLMMIDDAARCANSLNMLNREDIDVATMFQQLRHQYEKVSGNKYGVIICIFSGQRRTELRKTYRQGYIQFFKSAGAEKDERDWLIYNFGEAWYNRLRIITDKIQCGDSRYKSLSIGYLPTLGKDLGGVGFYHSKLVHVPQWPDKMLVKEDLETDDAPDELPSSEDPSAPSAEELKAHATWYAETDELSRYAQFYQLYYLEKVPKSVIANRFGVKIRTVELGIKNYREALLYELYSNNQ